MSIKIPSCNSFIIYLVILGIASTSSSISVELTEPVTFNACPNKPGFLYHNENNCSLYYSCKNGVFDIHQCSDGTVFSKVVGACVQFNSFLDTCSRNNAIRECANHHKDSTVIPHPTECQRYYICQERMLGNFPQTWDKECEYPDMFDLAERRCKPFKETFCGPYRREAIDGCDYWTKRCAQCIPCNQVYPPCRGLPDGINPFYGREWTPYYVFCDTQRFMNSSQCQGETPIFHPIRKECVTIWEVPREHNGNAPSCEGFSPGFHPVEGPPTIYFKCPEESVLFCPEGQVFSPKQQACDFNF